MNEEQLIQAIAVTAELCGRTLSPEAARVFVDDLRGFDSAMVAGALKRCRKEVRGSLTVQDVVSRLDDGRPGPEEAWASIPNGEGASVVWTVEMSQAWGVAAALIDAGETVAARMAFKETYTRLVNQARDHGQPVKWLVSLGHDPRARTGVLALAVQQGKISAAEAHEMCPLLPAPAEVVLLALSGGVRRVA